MHVVAVTGGLGAGKSTAAEVFADLGAVVIDLDQVAKTLLDEAPAVRDRVIEAFGDGIVGADGRIDHAALAATAFATPEATARLDSIVHPAVLHAVAGALDTLVLQGEQPHVVVLVVPLLAEAPSLLDLVDAVVAISASEELRIERAVARGMSEPDAENRIARQVSDSERAAIADYIIENDGDLDDFRAALVAFWETEIAPREW
jgi:dephospho-CoA kinase